MEYERNIRTNIFAADNMTWGQYAKELTVNLVVIGIAYWKLCFQALNGLSAIASKVLFLLLIIFIVGVEASLVDKKGKNTMNAYIVAILGFGIYNIAAYFKVFKSFISACWFCHLSYQFYICVRSLQKGGKNGAEGRRKNVYGKALSRSELFSQSG